MQGNFEEAVRLYKRSIDIREKALGADHPAVAIALSNLAGWLGKQVTVERVVRKACRVSSVVQCLISVDGCLLLTDRCLAYVGLGSGIIRHGNMGCPPALLLGEIVTVVAHTCTIVVGEHMFVRNHLYLGCDNAPIAFPLGLRATTTRRSCCISG